MAFVHHTSLPLRGVSPAINNDCPSRRARLDTIGRVPLPFFENLRMSNGPARSRFVVRPISGREIGTACPSRLERIDVLDADLKYGSAGGPDVGKPTMRAAVSMPTGPWPCRPSRVRVRCCFCKAHIGELPPLLHPRDELRLRPKCGACMLFVTHECLAGANVWMVANKGLLSAQTH